VNHAAQPAPSTASAWGPVVAAAPTQPPAQPAPNPLLSEINRVHTSSQQRSLSGESVTEDKSTAGQPRLLTEGVMGEATVAAPHSLATPPTEALQLDAGCSAGKAALWVVEKGKPPAYWMEEVPCAQHSGWGRTGAGHGTASRDAEVAAEQEQAGAGEQEREAAAMDEEEPQEQAPPYPITQAEISDGWDTLVNRSWLQCDECHRWRAVPKAVRDEVSVCAIALHAPSLLALNRCVTPYMHTCTASDVCRIRRWRLLVGRFSGPVTWLPPGAA
jgi:hypothetical protein